MIDEKLVVIESKNNIITEPVYFLNGTPHAVDKCYLRQTVAEKIIKLSESLPDGYKLKIFDGWRPLKVQQHLFDKYKETLKIGHTHLSEEELNLLAAQFVSLPKGDIWDAPVHCTGGAVDITLTDKHGNELDMGTAFDDFTQKANTGYFEQYDTCNTARTNRRLLCKLMKSAGFTNFESEWWHFDYGNKFWAERTQKDILYGGIFELQTV